ncbi:MAG: DegV family EDD domain-containing protein [Lachnospiraceae bacterium]|nr:DegV family EDD domain-containing protein [Lachnospiraceae bacterium]
MKKFLKNAFNIGLDDHFRGFTVRLCETTFHVMTILWASVLFVDCILFIYLGSDQKLYTGMEFGYGIMYILMAALALIVLAVVFWTKKNAGDRYRIYIITCDISATLAILWALIVTYFDAGLVDKVTPSLIMIVAMSIPLCHCLSPGVYVILDVAGCIGFFRIMAYCTSRTGLPDERFYYHAIFFVVQFFIGLSYIVIRRRQIRNSMEIEKQKEDLEYLLDAQNHFFSNMSHEIRTPVNTIVGLNEMILREDISDEVAEDAESVRAAGKILLQLVNDILDLSQLESGQMQITPVTYKSMDMISEVVGLFREMTEKSGLQFLVEISSSLPATLEADDVRIRQILINVLGNAVKYTKEGSVSLQVECREESDDIVNVIYSVSDTGIGVKKENMPYLFDAFKRVDSENNRKIEGTGLGLSIVKGLVDQMGGNIAVNSIAGHGTTFVIEIPQKRIGKEEVGVFDIKAGQKEKHKRTYTRSFEAPEAKVLIVDDNVPNLMVLEKLLRDTKVQIRRATSGAEALSAALDDHYDVILLDDLMPEMSGVETLHKLRTQPGGLCGDSKVIACTAKVGNDKRLYYEKEGFDGYLEKPLDGLQLEKELFMQLPESLVIVPDEDGERQGRNEFWLSTAKTRKHLAISTESVADLPLDLIKAYDIGILYHKIHTDEGTFKDTLEIDQRGLLTYVLGNGGSFTSASPGVEEHEEFFAGELGRAKNLIHLTVSEKVRRSGHLIASEAAQAFDDVIVIDTMHLSSGTGLVVLEACRLANAGMSVDKIVEKLNVFREKVHTSFIVDSTDFLAGTGQVSIRVASILGSLSARPIIRMKNGKITLARILFESREKAWETYISLALKQPHKIDRRILFVTYVGLTAKELDYIKAEVEKRVSFDTVYFQEASPAIAVNCGPGTFGLLFQEI